MCRTPDHSCLLKSAALPLILQHPCISQQQDSICRLLCTSKALQSVVAHHCAGQVPMTLITAESQAADRLCAWLRRNGTIVRTLNFQVQHMTAVKKQSIATALGASLEQAAKTASVCADAPPEGLSIRSYCSNLIDFNVLQQLPCSHLTRLTVSPISGGDVLEWFSAAGSYVAQRTLKCSMAAQQALTKLSNLQSLSLYGRHGDILLPAILRLSSLTELLLDKISSTVVGELQHLPGHSLQHLSLTVSPNMHGWQRKQMQPQLGHLTALRSLSCTGEGLFAVQQTDVLPTQLTGLTVVDCPAAQPLLPLQQLQVLQMTACTMRAAELQQLNSNLKQLRQVRLAYDRDPDIIKAAAAGWASVPLRDLVLRVYPGPVAAQTIQELSRLMGLTHLNIGGYAVRCEVTTGHFAGMITQLTSLRELKLTSLRFLPGQEGLQDLAQAQQGLLADHDAQGPVGLVQVQGLANPVHAAGENDLDNAGQPAAADTGASSHGIRILLRAIASLPYLQSLSLNQFSLGSSAAELAAATGLTSLKLNECELVDTAIEVLAVHLAGLRRLSLSWNFTVSDAVLGSTACSLLELEHLSVCSTKVSDASMQLLRQRLPGVTVVG